MPPFPIEERVIFSGCEVGILKSMLREDRDIAVVLVRLGAYAVGVCSGERLVASKVGTGLIHSRQRQGGSSSQRFRRRREKQIEQFLIRVCEKVDEHVGSRLERIDFVAYGGARTTIELLKKRCPILSRLEDRQLPPLLDIGDPRQPVLDAAVKRIWSSHIVEWRADDDGH
jgi:peptide subunit release factor 1 (eRF1)